MRLLLGVYDLVPAQGARLPEPLAANLANEGPHSGMDGHMSRQVVVGVEALAAIVALENFIAWRLLIVGDGVVTGVGARSLLLARATRLGAGRHQRSCERRLVGGKWKTARLSGSGTRHVAWRHWRY